MMSQMQQDSALFPMTALELSLPRLLPAVTRTEGLEQLLGIQALISMLQLTQLPAQG